MQLGDEKEKLESFFPAKMIKISPEAKSRLVSKSKGVNRGRGNE